ncbi:glycoside hydrolase family 15 protein [Fulvivirga sediminis]|uniref:Glycoside hydrolase family 15 protein n=1 Tax=Fulvivirga sediminis TaxID=2803949 RepID=A0A937F846_9BACT|nr:glycoside hydrolase family 15 protein [Fulvivirga sediminis]MBL3658071.1 glycoside hydrolase family 15 protein [Fulvivirga sediminis]
MNKEQSDYNPIANYGVIGNQNTIALVGMDGAIDFMCFPRFDSPSIFASILDKKKGGSFQIIPDLKEVDYKQQYLPETNVLVTRFLAYEGMVEITDFMPVKSQEGSCELIRKVTVIRGKVAFKMKCEPRFEYAKERGKAIAKDDKQVFFEDGDQAEFIRLVSDIPLKASEHDAWAEFELEEKESACFVLEAVHNEDETDEFGADLNDRVHRLFIETVNYWKSWVGKSKYQGKWLDMVQRSALTLKLLTSHKYGAPVAAATFGLPEHIGGTRNWDYRFTWIRDAAFTMYAFIRMGYTEEAGHFMDWIRHQFDENMQDGSELQLMYGVDGKAELKEMELDHLEGYMHSTPVRIGNEAYDQLQMDIYGELMDSIYLYDKYGEPVTYKFWESLKRHIEYVCDNWQVKDHGIWEIRSEKREFLYSRVMCWVAVDRAIRLAEKRSFPYPFERWRKVRDEIYTNVYEDFWNDDLKAFVQYKGADVLDASALLMPLVRFISPYDPRWQSTMEAIEEELATDSLVYRYNTEHDIDGLNSEEGTFSVCSFWYVECLCRGGQVEKARLFFEKMLSYGNHLGLYAEQIGLRGEQLGNFPQAFTHLGLISAAYAINRAIDNDK